MKPCCFCSPKVDGCPICSKVDWTKVQKSNGDADRDRIVSARANLAQL